MVSFSSVFKRKDARDDDAIFTILSGDVSVLSGDNRILGGNTVSLGSVEGTVSFFSYLAIDNFYCAFNYACLLPRNIKDSATIKFFELASSFLGEISSSFIVSFLDRGIIVII